MDITFWSNFAPLLLEMNLHTNLFEPICSLLRNIPIRAILIIRDCRKKVNTHQTRNYDEREMKLKPHLQYGILPTTFITAADLVEKTLQVLNIRFSGHVDATCR